MQDVNLTPASYIVLGLLERAGEATPYDLKQMVSASVGNLWSLQHAQLYTEPERLAAAGLLKEEREDGGRRRRHYRLTKAGRRALDEWRANPTGDLTELRDPGLLQLFFGAEPGPLAAAQVASHKAKLAEYEEIHRQIVAGDGTPDGPRLSLEAGIAHERVWIRFWSQLGSNS